MATIRNLAKVLVALWFIGMLAFGLGTTWLAHNAEDVALAVAEHQLQAESASVEERQRQAEFNEQGWGDVSDPYEAEDAGWGEGG